MKARLANKDFGHGLSISVRRSPGFGASTLHGHDFYELDIVTGGRGSSSLNGKPYTAENGCVFFLTPEDYHEYVGDGSVDILNLQFFGDAVSSDILRRITDRKSRIYTPAESDISSIGLIFSAIEENIKQGEAAFPICSRLLEAILLTLLKGASGEGASMAGDKVIKSDMQRALVYIHEHFKDNPPLGEVASSLPLNERYFCQKFKEYTGKSYKDYLRDRKLRYARRLVLATSLSMIKIAEESGYATQSHFNREFKSHFGISPTAMRHRAVEPKSSTR